MQHEQWATVQLEQPNFVAKRGLSTLIACYAACLVALSIIGFLAPEPIHTKVYRDVDYEREDEVRGTSITLDAITGDALWDLQINDLNPEKQFIFINARVQRPGWNTGPLSARHIDFGYHQEYTLFSQLGTSSHYLSRHSDDTTNHTHSRRVHCRKNRRFCDSFSIYHKDYLPASHLNVKVLFYKPQFLSETMRKLGIAQVIHMDRSTRDIAPSPSPFAAPTPSPTEDFYNFHQNATWTVLMERSTMNEEFTKFELGFRYFFLAITLIICFRYIQNMNQLSAQMWGYQQKWIVVLLCALVLFDGPLSAARIYAFNEVNLSDYSMGDEGGEHTRQHVQEAVGQNQLTTRIITDVNTLCITSFIAICLIYYLCILEEMGSGGIWKFCGWHLCTNRIFSNGFKTVLVGTLWSVTFLCYLYVAHQSELDPSFSLFGDEGPDSKMKYLVVALAVLFTLYFIWLITLIFDSLRALKDLTAPFRFIAVITFISIALTVSGLFTGGYYFIPSSSTSFAIFFGATNVYVYTLAFGYMPQLDGMALASEDIDESSIIEMIENESGFMSEAVDFENEDDVLA